MLTHGQCVRGDFQFHEIKAWGHFAYNVGDQCLSEPAPPPAGLTLVSAAACDEIWKWRYVKVNGVKRDCALLNGRVLAVDSHPQAMGNDDL
ncbi:hypothetical protein SNK04_014182 [Fusarium graminearum]